MKVILLQDIARVGVKNEVKDVPSGHALNFLIPRKMAEPATKSSLKRLKETASKVAVAAEGDEKVFEESLAKLAGEKMTMELSANEQGHLFQGVKAEDISKHLKENGTDMGADKINLEGPIKEVGEHTIKVSMGDKKGEFVLEIIPSK